MKSHLIFVTIICVVTAYNYDPHYNAQSGAHRRQTVSTLKVSNGGPWGSSIHSAFCPEDTFAIGYSQKIEGRQGRGDDTALNSIALLCAYRNLSLYHYTIVSPKPIWGSWRTTYRCRQGEFLTSFTLQVEPRQGRGDDTAANFVTMSCRKFTGGPSYAVTTDVGYWGNFGFWSDKCPANSAICGLETAFEPRQGRGDDTALNDVKFFCCNEGILS